MTAKGAPPLADAYAAQCVVDVLLASLHDEKSPNVSWKIMRKSRCIGTRHRNESDSESQNKFNR